MLKKKEVSSEALYGEYGEAFNFTFGDLESNRAGFLSHRQKSTLARLSPDWFIVAYIPFSLGLVILGVLIDKYTKFSLPVLGGASTIFLGILWLALFICGEYMFYKYNYKKNEGNLMRFDSLIAYQEFTPPTHFPVNPTEAQWALLRAHPKFRIYACRTNKRILSLEATDS